MYPINLNHLISLKRSFGKKVIVKRSIQASWFDRWPWLHSIALMSAVCKLLSLVLVMPATNAVSERSFSCLRRLKSYLRSTMSQSRLNNVMVLHVHKNLTDKLSLVDIGNNFISGSSHRESLFSILFTVTIWGVTMGVVGCGLKASPLSNCFLHP